jgi:hypothetical protein
VALTAWQHTPDSAKRCFSVFIDSDLPEGTHQEVQAAAREAASQLLSLPWELLHDGRSYLFQGARAVRVRRRLPNRYHQPVLPTRLPIRILLVSPRPEDERTGYIDHRISANTPTPPPDSSSPAANHCPSLSITSSVRSVWVH